MAELLFEILSEEIPARMQERAAEDLLRLVSDGLATQGLAYEAARALVSPRRLALVIQGLPSVGPDVSEERRGPRVGAPASAMEGFLKSTGLALDQLEKRDAGKGEFWFAVLNRKGRPTAEVLKEAIEAAMAVFPWPKSMRWGRGSVRWVRPIHSLLCLFEGAVVPVSFGTITAGNATVGHRFLAPASFPVRNFSEYQSKLLAAKVMLDPVERRHAILRQAEAAAAREGLSLPKDDALLAEVTGLVEWPTVLVGSIDESFMGVPQEALMTSMRAHQKYFPLLKETRLAPRFLVVSNMESADQGRAIVAGNERVLRARLSDAAFFWSTDRKVRLDSRLPKLAERLFYARLGTLADKASRLKQLAPHLSVFVNGTQEVVNPAEAARAAELAKADLSTEMVGEFPELQGIMGRYYALHDGESPAVAEAIAEHYAPLGPSDRVPTQPLSVCVALADKIDSLVGFFGIDEKPTGSKDPFALRRAALGVIRLVLENGLRLPLFTFLQFAHSLYKAGQLVGEPKMVANDLLEFFADRLKVHLKEKGVRHDLISAIFVLGDEDDLVRLLRRVDALSGFLTTDDGGNLLTAYRRAANIVRIEEKKEGVSFVGAPSIALLTEPEEQTLVRSLMEVRTAAEASAKAERFTEAMAALSQLRGPLDAFFDKIKVNADDPVVRVNRLKLLSGIVTTMNLLADFSKIEG